MLLGLVGCDRRLEPWVDADQEPAASGQPVRIPGLERPAPAPFAAAPEPVPSAPARGAAAAPIQGTLRLAGAARVPPGGVLFVIARSGQGGPPLAVRRMPAGPFPLEFSIGPEHAMIQGRPFAGPLTLSARVDADGDPLTRSASDLVAAPLEAVEPGASGLELVLAPGGA